MSKPPLYRLSQFYGTLGDVAEVLDFGEKKYQNNLNWQSYPQEDDLDAALRHIFKYRNSPEDTGEGGSGKSHLINAIARLLFAHAKESSNIHRTRRETGDSG